MYFEVIQKEIAQWPPETVRRLQGYLVSLNHHREGWLDRFADKRDDPEADHWASLEEVEAQLCLGAHDDGKV